MGKNMSAPKFIHDLEAAVPSKVINATADALGEPGHLLSLVKAETAEIEARIGANIERAKHAIKADLLDLLANLGTKLDKIGLDQLRAAALAEHQAAAGDPSAGAQAVSWDHWAKPSVDPPAVTAQIVPPPTGVPPGGPQAG